MQYLQEIISTKNNPQQMEALFQEARARHESGQFMADLETCFSAEPDNLLLQAWHYRLQSSMAEPRRLEGISGNWKLAIPLAILNGLVLWLLSGPKLTFIHQVPWLALLAAPITAVFVMAFLALTAHKNYRRSLAVGIGLAFSVAVAILFAHRVAFISSENYLILAALHLALLALAGVGVSLVGLTYNSDNRFAFLMKSLEIFIVGGSNDRRIGVRRITLAFQAYVELPETDRLIAVGGAGLILVIACDFHDPGSTL
jgi:hypothetical protein